MACRTAMASSFDHDHHSTTPKTLPKTDLQKDDFSDLWYRLHVFVYDLRNFTTDPTARDRLNSMTDPAYLGKPYFSEKEVLILKSTEVGPQGESLGQRIEDTLGERLNRRMKKSVQTADFRVCAAHDLAPIFEKAFDINHKKLAKDAKWMTLMISKGVASCDPESAKILGRPFESKLSGNQMKKNQKQRKKG